MLFGIICYAVTTYLGRRSIRLETLLLGIIVKMKLLCNPLVYFLSTILIFVILPSVIT